MNRDTELERKLTDEAAASVAASADHLNDFAEHRAGTDPVHDPAHRDFGLEAAEELADARNYVVWWLDQPQPYGDMVTDELRNALAAITVAYEHVDLARRLTGSRNGA